MVANFTYYCFDGTQLKDKQIDEEAEKGMFSSLGDFGKNMMISVFLSNYYFGIKLNTCYFPSLHCFLY